MVEHLALSTSRVFGNYCSSMVFSKRRRKTSLHHASSFKRTNEVAEEHAEHHHGLLEAHQSAPYVRRAHLSNVARGTFESNMKYNQEQRV